MSNNKRPIPFDQYQRYGVAARAINALRKNGESFRILEVGSNIHKLLEHLLPNDQITYLDREIPAEMQGQSEFVVGDATELTLQDASYDIVVALDVFEHIPLVRREAFLYHTCRVARQLTLIGAPFDSPSVVQAEREARSYWNSLFHHPYRWLDEHAENGLPDLGSTTKFVDSLGYCSYVVKHGDINLWAAFIKGHFAEVCVESLRPVLSMLYEYYQNQFFEKDFSQGECYRQFLFCSRDSEVIEVIKDSLIQHCDGGSDVNREFFDRLLSLLPAVATEKAKLDQAIVERDARISSLTQDIAGIRNSLSWRITSPFRWLLRQCKRMPRLARFALRIVSDGGGLRIGLAKAWRVLRREGWTGLKHRLILLEGRARNSDRSNYREWVKRYDTLDDVSRKNIKDRILHFPRAPKISIVMPVYDPPLRFLDAAIWSVRNQLYPNWELCIADDASRKQATRDLLSKHAKEDARIKVVFRQTNGHISAASNSALELATGEYVALLDHDDLLSEHALFWVAQTILDNPDAGLIYSDEDKISENGVRYEPYFKCELNPELLLAQNMISHLGVYRSDLLAAVGGFRTGFEGAQDYDLALNIIERLEPENVVHIPRVLYHWRSIAGSTALGAEEKNYAAEAGRQAVADYLRRRRLQAEVGPAPQAPALNRVRFALPSPAPMVSVIIPTRDRADMLATCIHSIISRSTYHNFEIIIVDNGSVEPRTANYFATLPSDRITVIRDDGPFNFSRLNNVAARHAKGEVLCLMNNDIEILTPDWLEEMVSFASQAEVGCVGAKLWYPDNRLQHGGVILGVGGVAGHSHKYLPKGYSGYFCRINLHQSLSAVTAACLVIRRSVYEAVGGLDETFAVAFNDVDFCLRVRGAGYRNVWTPYAEMIHHESVSRGAEDNSEKKARFADEVKRMEGRWGEKLKTDPAYSPNLTLEYEDFSFAWPPRGENL